jgi:glycosyltransferase involved in cell wall biosynthesis
MKISVIMAVYNGQRFLGEALDSILQQTFTDFELLVVDDGSTDSTPQILSTYAERDSRLRVIRQPNGGVSAAVNRALARAQGEFIARMDSDDRMLPDRLERQLKFFNDHPEASVVCGHAHMITANGKRIGKSQASVDVELGLKEQNPSRFVEIIQSTVLMRRQDLLNVGRYNEDITYSEDRELWGRFVTAGKMIQCQPEFLLEFRLHSGAMSIQKAYRNSFTVRRIDFNIIRAMQGQPQLSPSEFEQWHRNKSLWQKINDDRCFYALFHFKNASRYYAEHLWLPFVYSLGIAVILRPHFIFGRMINKLA